MLRDAARERGEDLRARTDGAAPQHEGRRGRCILAKRSQLSFWPNEPKQYAMLVLILRSERSERLEGRGRPPHYEGRRLEKDGAARALMLRDAARERGEDLRARTDGAAPQHEGRERRCILAK